MSGDTGKLTRIEEWAQMSLSIATIARARDVLALVVIARRARPMADLPWPLSSDERQEWIVNQTKLRDALSALDGDT